VPVWTPGAAGPTKSPPYFNRPTTGRGKKDRPERVQQRAGRLGLPVRSLCRENGRGQAESPALETLNFCVGFVAYGLILRNGSIAPKSGCNIPRACLPRGAVLRRS